MVIIIYLRNMFNIKLLIILLILFPSVTFHLVPTEIFPYAIFSIAYLGKSFVYVFLVGSIFGMVGNIFWSNLNIINFVASWGALTNATIPFFLTKKTLYNFVLKSFYLYFWIIISICLMQWSGLFYFLQPLIEAMIPRGSMIGLGGSRGVTALSSEPSRAAYEFCMVSYVILLTLWNQNATKKLFLYSTFCLLFLIMNKSLTGIILYTISFAFFLLHLRAFTVFIYLLVSIFILSLLSTYLDLLPDRIQQLILFAIKLDFGALYEFLTYQSYHRFDVYVKSVDFVITYLHGVGFGNWDLAQALSEHSSPHVERVPYFLQLALEVGFFPMCVLLLSLIFKAARANSLILATPQLITLSLIADPGSPVVPLCFSLTVAVLAGKHVNSKV